MTSVQRAAIALAVTALLAPPLRAQLSESAAWTAWAASQYRVLPNITYLTANNFEARVDLYLPREAEKPTPTLIYIHGGGWVGGSKEGAMLQVLPYMELGWAVVNVQYRLGKVSLAPAAVEDCRCALRWVYQHAKEYRIDTSRLVVTGHSAGGHLSLTTAMLPASAGLDRQCPGTEDLRVAAIVNWYGITDVGDLLEGVNMKSYAVGWMGSMTNRGEIARRVSPIEYVRAGLPPTLTVHGDADPTVPYQHAVRLHSALERAGVPNQLVTVPGGKHGGFTRDETLRIHTAIRKFLAAHGLLERGAGLSSDGK